MLPVRSSGDEGSIVAFAVSYCMEYQAKKKLSQTIRLSPRQIYYAARLREGTAKEDSGAVILDALRAMQSEGTVAEDIWPYISGHYADPPPPAVSTAKRYKLRTFSKLSGATAMKAALASSGPIIAGMVTYMSIFKVYKTGVVPIPTSTDQVAGGIAICIVGFDDAKRVFKFENSWGTGWGDHGYGYLPYDYPHIDGSYSIDCEP
jgi:C1A family cysteine protease